MAALVNPPPSSPGTSKSMRGNRARDTEPELKLRKLLRDAGYGGYRLHWKVPGRPDIAYPGRRIAIFVNGDYWHRCPHCNPPMPKTHQEFWKAKFERNVERDDRKARQLQEQGWTVLTVWECEIRDAPDDTLRRVVRVLEDHARG